MKKIFAWFAVIVTTIGLSLTLATPAQAWSYCNPVTYINNRVMLWTSQGYCPQGQWVAIQPGTPGQCVNLSTYGVNNWAGAYWNTMDVNNLLQDSPCGGGGSHVVMLANTSDPDLFNNGLYRTASAVVFGG